MEPTKHEQEHNQKVKLLARKLAGAFIALINDAARPFFSWPDERQEKRDMKQPKAQDPIRHMEPLKAIAGVQEMEDALISSFKTGERAVSANYKLQA